MSLINWDKNLETGNPVIDGQHKRLFALVNDLYDSIEQKRTHGMVGRAIDEVTAYAANHFESEERLMEKHGYPNLEHHRALHNDLRQKTKLIANAFRSGTINLNEALPKFLADWVQRHILIEDQAFAHFLADKEK